MMKRDFAGSSTPNEYGRGLLRRLRRAASGVRIVFALSLGVGAFACSDSDIEEQLQKDVEAIARTNATPGVVAEFATEDEDDRVAVRTGVGDRETGQPVPFDGYFRVASNTKTYVAIVALQLVAEGQLSLQDTVEAWLPGLVAGNDNDGRAITLRHLLQQTSGLFDYDNALPALTSADDYVRDRLRIYSAEQLIEMAMKFPPDFEPGERWSYSNTNYILTGMIIERATGRTWQEEVIERVIEPLGLTATFPSGTSPDLPDPHARTYQQFSPGGELVDTTVFVDNHADGAIVSTTGDNNRFFRGLLSGELLPSAQLAEMLTTVVAEENHIIMPDAEYGLGLFWQPLPCSDDGYWSHGGDGLGYSNRDGVTPDGTRSVTLFMTGRGADVDALIEREALGRELVAHALCDG